MTEISQTLDQILNLPPDQWGSEQLQIYQILEQKITHYRRHFLEAQFRQDIQDIQDNIRAQAWFQETSKEIQAAINQLLQRLRVTTFNLARNQTSLRVNLNLKILENQAEVVPIGLKLQYFNSPNKFLYYLYLEDSSTEHEQRAYLAHNHPELERVSPSNRKIPELDIAYRKLLPVEFRQIPAGLLMKIVTEIIMFYDETGTVIKTPISLETKWSLEQS